MRKCACACACACGINGLRGYYLSIIYIMNDDEEEAEGEGGEIKYMEIIRDR